MKKGALAFQHESVQYRGVSCIINSKIKNLIQKKLEKGITDSIQDEDVTKNSGIYEYVLTRNKKYLNIRAFTENQKPLDF